MKAKTGLFWIIEEKLTDKEAAFLNRFDPVIYWSDEDGGYRARDRKLPSGRLLENMHISLGAETRITANVY